MMQYLISGYESASDIETRMLIASALSSVVAIPDQVEDETMVICFIFFKQYFIYSKDKNMDQTT